jgi:aerotolerance regulator-like protein/VWA domain-containing protein
MGFLAPLFLLAMAAIIVPIVVHLREKQRKTVVEFPSLMFLSAIPFRSVQKRKIRHWILLLARALAIALLVAAFARPFFTGETAAVGTTFGPKEIVLVVDRSYSMAYGDRWEQAKEIVRQQVARMEPTDRVSLVLFGRGAQAMLRSTSEPQRLLGAIDTASVSAEVTRYGPGLKLAQTILEESDLPNREVVMIGDFQRAGYTGDEGVTFPAGTTVTPFQVGAGPTSNAAVTSVAFRRDFFSGRERMTATARVVRSGGDEAVELPVVLELDGQEMQRRTVTLEPTGSAGVTFQPFTLAEEFTRGRISIGEDNLLPDNDLQFVLSPGRALSVLILEGRSARRNGSLFLRRALEISEDAAFRVETRASSAVTEVDVTSRAVIILNDARFPSGASGERLRRFVDQGGGLLVALGERSVWTDAQDGLLPGKFGPAADDSRGGANRLGFVDYSHHTFEIFAGPRSGDFSRARFFRFRPITPAAEAEVLARFDDGSVALAEMAVGEGRVMMWGSTLDAFWNDLALQPVFLPFVHNVVRYLGGHRERVPWFKAGEVLDLADQDALASAGLGGGQELPTEEERVAIAPGGGSVFLPATEGPRYLELRERGFYVIRPPGSEEPRPFTVAVNVDVAESELAMMDPAELAAAVAPREGSPGVNRFGGLSPELRARAQERSQALWQFLLLGALLLLMAETIASNWMSRTVTRRSS